MRNKLLLKIKLLLVIMLMMVNMNIVSIDAASFQISKSSVTLYVGEKTTVTVNASNVAGGPFSVSSSNKSVAAVSGLNGEWLENNSGKVTITAKAEGTCTITIKATVANLDDSSDEDTVTKTVKVTVKKKTTTNNTTGGNTGGNSGGNTTTVTKSKDNNLSSLTVSTGTLSPEFKASTTSYTVNLDGNATKITISAKANHSKAKVSGTGEKSLKVGNNTFEVKCTAENGSVKTYKINVYVDETPLVYTTYKDKKLGVVRNTDSIGVPSTFEAKTITLDGQEVKGYYSAQFNKTIVYLSDENNAKSFYIYEENKGIVSIFKPVSILGRNLYVVDLAEEDTVKEEMTYQEIEIDGQKIMGWIYNNPAYANYKLFTAMNEFGQMVLYQHEKTENSLQIYLEEVPVIDEPVDNQEEGSFETILMGATGFFACTTIIMFIIHLRFKKKSIASIKSYYEKRNQE